MYLFCMFFFSLFFVTATFALSKTANPPKPILSSLFFRFNKSAERKRECMRERKKERERDTHMLTYQTNDGKRYNTNLVIIF